MTDQQRTYRVRLRVGDQELEVEGDDTFVEEQFRDLAAEYLDESPSNRTDSDEEQTQLPATTDTKHPSLAEIYQEASIKYKRHAALLVGWYIELVEGKENFTRSEIQDAAIDAKIELGKNLSRDINRLVEDGLLFKLDERNNETAYYVTRTGESYVTDEFDIQLDETI